MAHDKEYIIQWKYFKWHQSSAEVFFAGLCILEQGAKSTGL